ncbi:MAG TPA: molybdopterin-dependent oxidoreductase [Trebonia sp.]|nr:molybdopterin-dependent oxidoreductase [Trebonia sp.]
MSNEAMDGARRPSAWTGAISGLITAAVAIGVAQLVAGLTRPQASPVVAVGQSVIGSTPLPVKEWATSTFGTNDKTVLIGGVLVLLFAFAAVIGIVAMRRLAYGMAGLGVFAAIGLAAVLTRPDATGSWIWATLVGACGGGIALARLVKAATEGAAARAAQQLAAQRAARRSAAAERRAQQRAAARAAQREQREAARAGQQGATQPQPAAQEKPTARETLQRAGETGWIPGGISTGEASAAPAGSSPARQPRHDAGRGDKKPGAPGPKLVPAASRRAFLWTAGVSLVAAGAGEYIGREASTRQNVAAARSAIRFPAPAVKAPPLPAGINPKVAGLSSFITPNSQFYRVDTTLVLPEVSPVGWTLRIHGMVRREVTISFDELLRRPLIEDYITLTCVSDPVSGPDVGNAKWLGASLASLVREAGPAAGADQLLCTSVDGFTSGTPLAVVMDGRDALVAVAMNGAALPVAHGFPARLVTPGLYGYVSACKWVTDIEVTTFAQAQGYWVSEGWAQQAPIKTESRIDVPNGNSPIGPGPVTVAGVAWAQHKGIAAVEVQVDNGPWNEATLAPVPNIDTWRQWTWQWTNPAPGNHTIQARATDKTGYTQTSVAAELANGATGYPSVQVSVKG